MGEPDRAPARWLGVGLTLVLVAVVLVTLVRLVSTPVSTDLMVATSAPLAPAVAPATPAAVSGPTYDGVDQGPSPDPAWVATVSLRTGVPAPALTAYARAALRARSDCGLGWTTLAGIGWVESQHGTLDGRVLGPDGVSSTPIVGPALDGVGDVAAVPSTSYGVSLHGDPQWDHAVGPMQFISSTWQRWGADGDGDGLSDPQDVDDAAQAAALYLCADERDLTTGSGWSDGVLSYNRSQTYLDSVHAAATVYAERAAVDASRVG